MISALGTMVGALAATPIHYHFGDKGLLVMAGGTALVAVGALWAAGPRSAALMLPLRVIDLGRRGYAETLELQRRLCAERGSPDHGLEDILLLVEHEPVVTLGRTTQAVEPAAPARGDRATGRGRA